MGACIAWWRDTFSLAAVATFWGGPHRRPSRPRPPDRKARAKERFQSSGWHELNLQPGIVIDVWEDLEDGWLFGCLKHDPTRAGFFPCDAVSSIDNDDMPKLVPWAPSYRFVSKAKIQCLCEAEKAVARRTRSLGRRLESLLFVQSLIQMKQPGTQHDADASAAQRVRQEIKSAPPTKISTFAADVNSLREEAKDTCAELRSLTNMCKEIEDYGDRTLSFDRTLLLHRLGAWANRASTLVQKSMLKSESKDSSFLPNIFSRTPPGTASGRKSDSDWEEGMPVSNVPVRIVFEDQVHHSMLHTGTMVALRSLLKDLFGEGIGSSAKIRYYDEDDDHVLVCTDDDLHDAISYFAELQAPLEIDVKCNESLLRSWKKKNRKKKKKVKKRMAMPDGAVAAGSQASDRETIACGLELDESKLETWNTRYSREQWWGSENSKNNHWVKTIRTKPIDLGRSKPLSDSAFPSLPFTRVGREDPSTHVKASQSAPEQAMLLSLHQRLRVLEESLHVLKQKHEEVIQDGRAVDTQANAIQPGHVFEGDVDTVRERAESLSGEARSLAVWASRRLQRQKKAFDIRCARIISETEDLLVSIKVNKCGKRWYASMSETIQAFLEDAMESLQHMNVKVSSPQGEGHMEMRRTDEGALNNLGGNVSFHIGIPIGKLRRDAIHA